MAGMLPPFGWGPLLHDWKLVPGWTAFSVVLLGGYLLLWRRGRRLGDRSVHPVRAGCFVLGLVLLVVTVSSAIDSYAMSVFWVHMIEHLLLIMGVPALLVLGHPLAVVRAAVPEERRHRVDDVLQSWPVAVVTHPLVGMLFYGGVIVGTHLTGFMDAMVRHPWLMPAEQVLYVASGWLMLLTLIGDEPIRWRLPYLMRFGLVFVGMVPDTVVGIVLMQTNTDPFPLMFAHHPAWAPAPLRDLEIGGGLMWVVGDGLMMCYGVGLIVALAFGKSARNQVIGPWLESVRRQTLVDHVAASGETEGYAGDDVDDDEAALAAYNRMLARLNKQA
jgi:putative copper resistance protein D